MFNTRTITCSLAAATVGVFFIGSHAVAQQGGPSVTVVNTPLPVTVTNPTIPPTTVNIGNPAALAAANAQALVGTPVAFSLDSGRNTFSVPVGKRLVIEYVSGFCNAFTDPENVNNPFAYYSPNGFQFAVTTSGVTLTHFVTRPPNATPIAAQGTILSDLQFGQSVKVYADPGTNVTYPSGLGVRCALTFSGQLL